MTEFSGIKAEALWLLAQNKFNNSKEFYEENKEKINNGVIYPMRQIAAHLSPYMYKLDSKMNLIPAKMVSRIRRDTRFTNDKTLYREHVWIMFMRPKNLWQGYPCLWFEIRPGGYYCGVSYFGATTGLMEVYRRLLLEQSDNFFKAVKSTESVGAKYYADTFKREKNPDIDDKLKPYYNVKSFYFMIKFNDISPLASNEILKDLRKIYKAFSPMYRFLLQASERYTAISGGDEDV